MSCQCGGCEGMEPEENYEYTGVDLIKKIIDQTDTYRLKDFLVPIDIEVENRTNRRLNVDVEQDISTGKFRIVLKEAEWNPFDHEKLSTEDALEAIKRIAAKAEELDDGSPEIGPPYMME